MMTDSSITPFPTPQAMPSQPPAITRPLYWSVRREIWENRSLYVAPLLASAFVLFGFAVSTIGLAERRRAVLQGGLGKGHSGVTLPYDMAAVMLMATAFLVAVFYCIDALHSERRDRSILFWKSLPVSDRDTVLSKLAVAAAVMPLLSFVVILVTQLVMVLMTGVVLIAHGMSPFSTFLFFRPWIDSIIMLYGLLVLAVWQLPVFSYLLLVSAWARRAALLWAVFPILAIAALERMIGGTSHFLRYIGYRLFSGIFKAFAFSKEHTVESFSQLRPGRFLALPGLWLGLVAAALFLAIAIRLRRYREPI